MTITLTAHRKVALVQKIWVVSTAIGMIIAALPGVKHEDLHRTLESEKTAALHHNGNDYNGYVTLPPPPPPPPPPHSPGDHGDSLVAHYYIYIPPFYPCTPTRYYKIF